MKPETDAPEKVGFQLRGSDLGTITGAKKTVMKDINALYLQN